MERGTVTENGTVPFSSYWNSDPAEWSLATILARPLLMRRRRSPRDSIRGGAEDGPLVGSRRPGVPCTGRFEPFLQPLVRRLRTGARGGGASRTAPCGGCGVTAMTGTRSRWLRSSISPRCTRSDALQRGFSSAARPRCRLGSQHHRAGRCAVHRPMEVAQATDCELRRRQDNRPCG